MKKRILVTMLIMALGVVSFSGCGKEEQKETTKATVETQITNETEKQAENTQTVEIQSEEATQETAKEEYKVLRLAVTGSDDNYSVSLGNVAIKEGYLEEELNKIGYTVEIKAFQGGPVINEAIAAKELDGAFFGDLPAFTNAANGLGIEIIAVIDSKYQYEVLVGDTADINVPKDLEGKNVMVAQGTVIQYFWEKYVEANGIDSSKVSTINSLDVSTLFQTGDVQAAAFSSAYAYYFEEIGLGIHVLQEGINTSNSTFVAALSGQYIDENPEVPVAINKALIRAYETSKEDPNVLYNDQSSENVAAKYYEKAQAFDPTLDNLKVEITEDTLAYYEDFNQWLVDNQIIFEPVDLDEFIHTEYYEQALNELNE